ncbi:MAG: MFS transporter [Microbacteriaceae bacterium]
MPEPRRLPLWPRPLWSGRVLALLGILLVAFNLRSAVAALSPIFSEVRLDFSLSSVEIGVLGMLPPVCFAVFGIVAPVFTRRMSLEAVMLLSLVAILTGNLLRGVSGSFTMLAATSALAFAGMGVGNVLLPPLVKRYFPRRIGLMTALYATVMSVSTLLPPLVAVPVADGAGWRISVAMWAVLSLLAILPWLGILIARRPSARQPDSVIEEPEPELLGRIWHSPIAWSLAVVFAVSAINAYALFAWLPEVLHDMAGVEGAGGGVLLALYSAMGIPVGLLIPVLATRMKNIGWLIYTGVAFWLSGYLGLIFWPAAATWVWVSFAGLGELMFPLCLVMINLRSRTHQGAVALSGFSQGIGYTVAAFGPLMMGVLHQLTGAWIGAIIFLIGTALACALAGVVLARPRMLEDQVDRRKG